ncbi:MAG: CRISPR system Cascade subunit CasA [Verrucomicrobiales bacterium]|jgi:CRISPR system Cascade subunit CasA
MNLVTDSWIPVRRSGALESLSLQAVFENAGLITDVSVRPLERVALYRLLLCIAQRALEGPADHGEWKTARERIVPACLKYLSQPEIRAAFDLFGDGQRFLQADGLELAKGKTLENNGAEIAKLDFALASGNNSRLFDNSAALDRKAGFGEIAIRMLTFQCFSPGGLMPAAMWAGVETKGAQKPAAKGKVSGGDAPCLSGNMIHSWLRGPHLLATIHRNLLTKEDLKDARQEWGAPVWEAVPTGPGDDASAKTYLGRLVPMARAIRLFEDDPTRMILSNGLNYPFHPQWREPHASLRFNQTKNEHRILGARKGRAIWRDLHSVISRGKGEHASGAMNLEGARDADEPLDLVVTALVTTNAKFEEVIESVFVLAPRQQLLEADEDDDPDAASTLPSEDLWSVESETESEKRQKFQSVYENGIRIANSWERRLKDGVAAYQKDLMSEGSWRESAVLQFWAILEGKLPCLIRYATERNEETGKAWHGVVFGTAQEAYRRTCPADTPRQLQA